MAYLLHQLLSESATRYPDKVAVVFRDQTLTYAQLDLETNLLANFLLESGVQKGERISIYLDKSLFSIISVYGILKAGAACRPAIMQSWYRAPLADHLKCFAYQIGC